MILLPALGAAHDCRLPMADGSAARLAEALVDRPNEAAAEVIAPVLAADPPLVLWCVCRADRKQLALRSLREAAAWLVEHAVEELNWDQGGGLAADPGAKQRLAALVEANIERFEIGRFASQSATGPLDDPGGLVDLLDNGPSWLSACSVGSLADRATLPAWLSAAIAQRRPLLSACYDRLADTDRRAARRHAAAARDRWLAPGPLASSFLPSLVERLRRLASLEADFSRLLETEKLEAMAEFAAGAGHEINNPLAVISGRAQLFLREETDPERRRELALINSQAMRIYEMIADMMLYARPPQPELARIELATLLKSIMTEMRHKAEPRRIDLRLTGDGDLIYVLADGTQITVALRAVIENALEAIGSDGWIETSLQQANGAKQVEIVIRDSGPGIAAEVRRHLFDPYFSGRKAGRGLGMGLAKCWRIVTNHGGSVVAESAQEQGAAVIIRLSTCD